MTKPRKTKSDTTKFAVETMQEAMLAIPLPAHVTLPPEATARYNAIVQLRERSSWNEPDLECAALMAKHFVEIEAMQEQVARDGFTVGSTGGLKSHPLLATIKALEGQIIAMGRYLKTHSTATVGHTTRVAERNDARRAVLGAPVPINNVKFEPFVYPEDLQCST